MVRRIVLDNEKLLFTKPGFDVFDPLLTENDKIFDSRWAFSAFMLHSGTALLHWNAGSLTINFPSVGEIPFVLVIYNGLVGFPNNSAAKQLQWSQGIEVTEDTITLTYDTITGSYTANVHWYVFSLPEAI